MPSARRWICSALLVLGALSCAEHEPGVAVPVSQTHEVGAATFTTDRGYTVTLTRAAVVVRTVQIVPCATSARPMWRRALRGLARALSPEGEAFAHQTQVFDSLDVTASEDLMGGDAAPTELGEIPAWPTAHCGVKVLFGPSQDGHTLVVEGEATLPGGAPRAFTITSAAARPRLITVAAFEPAKHGPRPAITIVHAGVARWLDGVDLDAPDAGDVALDAALGGLLVRMGSE